MVACAFHLTSLYRTIQNGTRYMAVKACFVSIYDACHACQCVIIFQAFLRHKRCTISCFASSDIKIQYDILTINTFCLKDAEDDADEHHILTLIVQDRDQDLYAHNGESL